MQYRNRNVNKHFWSYEREKVFKIVCFDSKILKTHIYCFCKRSLVCTWNTEKLYNLSNLGNRHGWGKSTNKNKNKTTTTKSSLQLIYNTVIYKTLHFLVPAIPTSSSEYQARVHDKTLPFLIDFGVFPSSIDEVCFVWQATTWSVDCKTTTSSHRSQKHQIP